MGRESRRRAARTGALGLLVACAATAAPGGLPAQEPLITDRPDFTESASAVAPGRVQLEGGYTLARDGAATAHALGEVLARVGVVPRLELRLGVNSFGVLRGPVEDEGWEDFSVGAKAVLLEPSPDAPRAVPAVALLAGTTLPTGADGLGTDGAQPEVLAAVAWGLGPAVDLGGNVGWVRAEDEAGRFDEWRASGALGIGLTSRVGTFAEWFALLPSGAARTAEHFANTGLTYLVNPDLQLDARVGVGLDGPDPDYFVGAGLAIRR